MAESSNPVEILISEEKGVRQLHLGSEWVQGAMRIASPYKLELEYTREMLAGLLIRGFDTPLRRVLCVGLGVAALPKFFLKHFPATKVDVVEICPSVIAVCQHHFKLDIGHPNLTIYEGCGAEYVQQTEYTYDLILVDGFDEDARVGPLDSHAFYKDALKRLNADGVLVTNILAHELDPMLTVQRLEDAANGFALGLPPCGSGNVIALAANHGGFSNAEKDLLESVEQLKALSQLNLSNTSAKLKQFSQHPLFV